MTAVAVISAFVCVVTLLVVGGVYRRLRRLERRVDAKLDTALRALERAKSLGRSS